MLSPQECKTDFKMNVYIKVYFLFPEIANNVLLIAVYRQPNSFLVNPKLLLILSSFVADRRLQQRVSFLSDLK